MFPPHRGAGSRRRGGLERIRSRGRPVATLTMCGYTVGFVALFARCGGAKGGGVYKPIPSVCKERGRALDPDDSERHHWVRVTSAAFPDAAGDARMLAMESTMRETR